MKPRKVLLLEIGAGPLPSTTPTAPVASSWFPKVYTAPAPAVPGNFAVTAIVGGARITWDAVDGPNITYELQRAADGLSGPSAWITVTTGTDRVYNANESATTWWRVRALQRGVPSGWAVQAPITPTTVPTPEDVADAQAAAAAAQAAADAAQANVDSEVAARIAADIAAFEAAAADATAKVDAAKAELTARADALQSQLNDFLGQADPWSSTTAYPAGDFVSDSGKLYRAKQAVPAGTLLSDTAYWEEMGNYASAGDAISAALAQSTANASEIGAQATRLEGVEARMPAGTGELATAAALGATDARVTTVEGTVTAHANQLAAVSAELDSATQGLSVSFPPDALANWIVPVGAAVQTSYPATVGAMGGYVLRVGNNSGDDGQWARYKTTMPFDATKLYRIRVRYRRVTGTGLVSIGLVCLDASKSNYVRSNNTLIPSSGIFTQSHYAVNDAAPALGTWVEQEFYVKGRTAGAASGAWTLASPYQLPAQASHIAPLYIANYSAAAGETEFDYIIIEDAADKIDSTANASAISLIDGRVTSAEGALTAQSNSIAAVNAAIGAMKVQGMSVSFKPGSISDWTRPTGAGVEVSYPANTSCASGYAMRVGNNAGDDMVWTYFNQFMVYDPQKLYRVRARYRRVSGGGGIYIGLMGVTADGTQYVNAANGLGPIGAQPNNAHYFVSNAAPALGTWVETIFYFKGRAAGAASGTGTVADPRLVANQVAQVTPLIIANYQNAAGEHEFDYVVIEDGTNEIGDAANANAVALMDARVTSAEGSLVAQSDAITAVKSSIGGGGNMLSNTNFEVDVAGWAGSGTVGGGTFARDMHGFTWQPVNTHALVLSFANGTDTANYYGVDCGYIGVVAGKRYSLSAYLAGHRCNGGIQIHWRDNAGATLSISSDEGAVGGAGTNLATNYVRRNLFAVAPAGATNCRIYIFGRRINSADQSQCYLWIIRPMLAEVGTEATSAPSYAPGTGNLDAKYASVTQVLSTSVSNVQNQVNAKYGVYLDVNGRATGFESANNGVTSSFKVLADYFWVVSGAGYDYLKFNSGNLEVSGVLKGSRISAPAIDLASLVINCGSGRLAPATITDFNAVYSSSTGSRTVTVSGFVSPTNGSGYHFKRFSEFKKDVLLTYTLEQGNALDTPVFQVQIDGGAWTTIHNAIQFGSNRNTTRVYRYTTPDSWSTINFRVVTSTNQTYSAWLQVQVLNATQTGNAAGSFSDGSTAPTPPPPRPPSDEFCVDWETTVVKGGIYVRDLHKGDTFPGWRGDPNDLSIVDTSLIGMLIGNEQCYLLRHAGQDLIIQSESTPMVLPDGRCVRTDEMLGEHVLDEETLEWIVVDEVVDMGIRKVCKPDFAPADLFFAGIDTGTRRIATHNLPVK